MNPSHDEILTRFASRLACSYSAECDPAEPYAPMASSLPSVLSSSAGVSQGRSACTFPCLSHRTSRRGRRSVGLSLQSAASFSFDEDCGASSQSFDVTTLSGGSFSSGSLDKVAREAAHARLLARPLRFGRGSLPLAPAKLLRNFLTTFGRVLERELCKEVCLLIEVSETDSDAESATETRDPSDRKSDSKAAKKALSTFGNYHTSPIVPVSCILEYNAGLAEDFVSVDNDSSEDDDDGQTEEAVLPITFNAEMVFEVLGERTVAASLSAPGTISGTFLNGRHRPESIDVTMDTTELLRVMRRACRRVVRDALSTAGYEVPRRRVTFPGQEHSGRREGANKKGHKKVSSFGNIDESKTTAGGSIPEIKRTLSSPTLGMCPTYE